MKKVLLNLLLLFFIYNVNSQNWGEQMFNQPVQGGNNFFGYSVDIDGDYAVVGALGENERTGSAHIYKIDENGTWNYHQKLEAFVGKQIDDYFGWTVAIQGDYIFIGSTGDRLDEANFQQIAGSVLIYKKDNNDVWNGVQRIRASDIRIGDRFGSDVAVDGDFLVVGAKHQDYNENNMVQIGSAGAAYVFKKNANGVWSEIQKIVPSHRDVSDNIGRSISISGDYIVLASGSDTDTVNANPINGNGSVFVFKKNVNDLWEEVQKLKPTTGVSGSHFGFGDVTIYGDYIAVGAKNLDILENNIWYYGHVYLFKKDGDNVWNESEIVKTPFPASNFGSGVSLDQNLLLISAPNSRVENNGSNVLNVGLSYLFVKNANDKFVLAETLQASLIEANSTIGIAEWDGQPSTTSIAINNNHFIIGAPNIDNLNNPIKYNVGAAFISGNVDDLGLLDVLDLDNNSITSLNLYPNPVHDKLNISFSKEHLRIKVSLHNILGKKLQQKNYKNCSKINLKMNFPKGIYFVKVTLENNLTRTFKVVKNY